MAIRTTFKVAYCTGCVCLKHNMDLNQYECRLNPPTPNVKGYSSTYPVVSLTTPACFQAVPKPGGKKK